METAANSVGGRRGRGPEGQRLRRAVVSWLDYELNWRAVTVRWRRRRRALEDVEKVLTRIAPAIAPGSCARIGP